jgi:hypothetical protein
MGLEQLTAENLYNAYRGKSWEDFAVRLPRWEELPEAVHRCWEPVRVAASAAHDEGRVT